MDELKPMTIWIGKILRNRWHPSDNHRFLLRLTFMGSSSLSGQGLVRVSACR